MARLFTCADVLEQLCNGDVSSGDDSAYEGEGIVGYLYQLYAWDMYDMDLDASAMDERRLTM